jgi:hypothetical protein
VAPPALAEVRRLEQSIDHVLESFVRVVAHEGFDLFRSRRKAKQIESRATNERSFVGGRHRIQFALFESGEMKASRRVVHPVFIFHFGWSGALDRFGGPKFLDWFVGGRCCGPRIGRPILTHFSMIAIWSSANFSFGGIRRSGSVWRTAITMRLLSTSPGMRRCAGVAAFQDAFASVEEKSAFDLLCFGAVALETVLLEDWLNFVGEERSAFIGRVCRDAEDENREGSRGPQCAHRFHHKFQLNRHVRRKFVTLKLLILLSTVRARKELSRNGICTPNEVVRQNRVSAAGTAALRLTVGV